ncbi:MAG: type II secretion system secretin GspD [Magnetococcales bacterium]|nr:type II secretion system secretin GspD [Magnetococcales bacterium]
MAKPSYFSGFPGWLLGLALGWLIVASPMQATAADGSYTLNLKGADITTLIETVSQATGRNFILDPGIKGKVTVVSADSLSVDELYQVFLSILEVHNLITVPTNGAIKIVPETRIKYSGMPLTSQLEIAQARGDEVVVRVFELMHVDASRLVAVLRPMITPKGHLAAYSPSNMLIVSDYASGVRRIARIISRVDRPSSGEIEVVRLEHASAADLVRVLGSLLKSNTSSKNKSSDDKPMLVADDRTNSILIGGDKSARLRLRAIITHLDTPVEITGDTQVIYLRFANAKDLAPVLNNVGRDFVQKEKAKKGQAAKSDVVVNVQAYESANALVISAPPRMNRTLLDVVRKLDIRRAQVQVEAVVAEVSTGMDDELGIQWGILGGSGDEQGIVAGTNFSGSGTGLFTLAAQLGEGSSSVSFDPEGLSIGFTDASHIAGLIRALRKDTSTNILSTPTVVTMDNEEAEIIVGQNVPFITSSSTDNAGNPFQTITREDVGLSLKVTPQINEGDAIRMNIEFEDSVVTPSTVSTADVVTNTRSIKTVVMVDHTRILVLGGLIKDDLVETADKVPVLGDLPLLGGLFRYDTHTKVKTNLLVFLRPTILRNEQDGFLLTQSKYDYIRSQQNDTPSLGGWMKMDRNRPLLPELNSYIDNSARGLFSQAEEVAGRLDKRLDTEPMVPEALPADSGAGLTRAMTETDSESFVPSPQQEGVERGANGYQDYADW